MVTAAEIKTAAVLPSLPELAGELSDFCPLVAQADIETQERLEPIEFIRPVLGVEILQLNGTADRRSGSWIVIQSTYGSFLLDSRAQSQFACGCLQLRLWQQRDKLGDECLDGRLQIGLPAFKIIPACGVENHRRLVLMC